MDFKILLKELFSKEFIFTEILIKTFPFMQMQDRYKYIESLKWSMSFRDFRKRQGSFREKQTFNSIKVILNLVLVRYS